MYYIIAILILVTVTVGGGATMPMVVDQVAGNMITPGSPLYAIERFGESEVTVLVSMLGDRALFDHSLNLANERLSELEGVSDRDDNTTATSLVKDYETQLRLCMDIASKLNDTELCERIAISIQNLNCVS